MEAMVGVAAKESRPVLVVQRRPFTAFTERPMAWGAIILKNLGSLVVPANRVGHQILVCARLSGRLPVAVVADDAAALVNPEPLVLAGDKAIELRHHRLVRAGVIDDFAVRVQQVEGLRLRVEAAGRRRAGGRGGRCRTGRRGGGGRGSGGGGGRGVCRCPPPWRCAGGRGGAGRRARAGDPP